MALLDRVTGASPSRNSIEAVRKETSSSGAVADPEAVTRAYYVEDRGQERRYYDDYRRQSLAMQADAGRISSRREDLPTIRAMLAVAEARGWTEVKLGGSAEFRREAWIEAHARGIVAQGHQPTDPERQEAERRRTERSRLAPDKAGEGPSRPSTEPLHRAKPTDGVERAQHPSRPAVEAGLSPDGRLVFAALSSKIDRQMVKLTTEAKAELKAFAAAELTKKERAEGPVVLTTAQRAMARAPQPGRPPSPSRSEPSRSEVEPPRRVRGR